MVAKFIGKDEVEPFPWRCNHCGKKAVISKTIDYMFGELLVKDLVIPICRECGEMVFTYDIDKQIRG